MKVQKLTKVKFTGPFYIQFKKVKTVSQEQSQLENMIIDYDSINEFEIVGVEVLAGAEVIGLGEILEDGV